MTNVTHIGMAPDEVLPGLFLGCEKAARVFGATFDVVVNVTRAVPFPDATDATDASGPPRNAFHIRVPVNDDPFDSLPLYQLLRDDGVLRRMRAALDDGKRVLVHCQAGAQRSAAVVAAYLCAHHGMTPDQAVAFVRERRPAAFFWGVTLRRAIDLVHERGA